LLLSAVIDHSFPAYELDLTTLYKSIIVIIIKLNDDDDDDDDDYYYYYY